MRDLQNNLLNQCNIGGGGGGVGGQPGQQQKYIIPRDAIYKEVVIIGNGPSGISLSYLLAGNWPYWLPDRVDKHPDELLRARLNYADSDQSLIEQDLMGLADGLEGRTTNPVSLLLDSLTHPCADLGIEMPSMLNFKNHPDKQIDHIVLGKGPPGGSWHRMDPNLRTLSLSAWMSLPGMDFNAWQHKYLNNGTANAPLRVEKSAEEVIEEEIGKKSDAANTTTTTTRPLQRRNLSLKAKAGNSKEMQARALISHVAKYYEDYVREMKLEAHFWNDVTVTSVMPIRMHATKPLKNGRWLVIGTRNGRPMHLVCRNLVMANGSSDLANRLGLRAETMAIPWLKHELPQLEAVLHAITEQERRTMKPVLIVGAGLSAADAVTICRQNNIPVVHVYRNRTAGLDKMLPENIYPEYHEVHKMMKDSMTSYEYYTPMPEHVVVDLINQVGGGGVGDQSGVTNRVIVRHLVTGELRHLEVSYCAILIGARPDLRFLNSPPQPASLIVSSGGGGRCNSVTTRAKLIECVVGQRQQHGVGGDGGGVGNGAQIIDCYLETESCCPVVDDQKGSRLARQISWFKIFCAKCRHINFCERARRHDYKRICSPNFMKCECPSMRSKSEGHVKPCGRGMAVTAEDDAGLGLGEDPSKPIDGKNNPIAVDKYTNEVLRMPKGLYAMGPLVGDNFVRFIPGGALAITAALHREND